MYIIASTLQEYIPVVIQILVTTGAIFGSAGFWQWKQAKEQVKRDEISKETGIEKKVELLSKQVSAIDDKVVNVSEDVKQMKDDIKLLEQANQEAKKYLDSRSKQDEEVMIAQQAIIESLTGLLRERLLEAYTRCNEKGYYTEAERETYGKLFKCYESAPFNGNGVMHQLQPKMLALPWTREEAAAKSRN